MQERIIGTCINAHQFVGRVKLAQIDALAIIRTRHIEQNGQSTPHPADKEINNLLDQKSDPKPLDWAAEVKGRVGRLLTIQEMFSKLCYMYDSYTH